MPNPFMALENGTSDDLLAGQSLSHDKLIESSLKFFVGAHGERHDGMVSQRYQTEQPVP